MTAMTAMDGMHQLNRLYKKREALEWAKKLLESSKQEDPAQIHLSPLCMLLFDINKQISKIENNMKSVIIVDELFKPGIGSPPKELEKEES